MTEWLFSIWRGLRPILRICPGVQPYLLKTALLADTVAFRAGTGYRPRHVRGRLSSPPPRHAATASVGAQPLRLEPLAFGISAPRARRRHQSADDGDHHHGLVPWTNIAGRYVIDPNQRPRKGNRTVRRAPMSRIGLGGIQAPGAEVRQSSISGERPPLESQGEMISIRSPVAASRVSGRLAEEVAWLKCLH